MAVIQAQQAPYTEVVVTIAGRQWSCKLHSSGVDFTAYYSQTSIPAGTGFVIDFGSDQQFTGITIDKNAFGFNPDIALVTSAGQIVQILHSVETLPPSSLVFTGVARYFISVNAGELVGISTGSLVTITLGAGGGFDISTFLTTFMPLIMFVMVIGLLMPMTRGLVKSEG